MENASPFDWGDDERELAHPKSIEKLKGRPYIGSGFAALQQQLLDPQSDMTESAKGILKSLLKKNSVKLDGDIQYKKHHEAYEGFVRPLKRSKLPKSVTADEDVLEMARQGKLSVFACLLDAVESSSQPVPTKTLLRKCCLTIKPSDMPGNVDCKDYLLGALHFLSSRFESSSEDRYPSLPLIYPIQLTGDVEKRNYEKVGDWKLEDIHDKVLRLEQLFISSPHSWKWLRRESFAPRGLPEEEENDFFFRGAIPERATAKKVETGRKRKAPAASKEVPSEVAEADKQESNAGED